MNTPKTLPKQKPPIDLKPQERPVRKPRDIDTERGLEGERTAIPRSQIPYAPGEVRSFKKGGKVKKTGLAKVHKGEVILSSGRAAQLLGKSKRRKRKKR